MEPIPIPDESEPFQDKQDDVTNPESLDEVDEEEHKTFLRWQQRRQSRGLASFKAAYSRRSALYRSLIGVVLLSMIMLAILCTLGKHARSTFARVCEIDRDLRIQSKNVVFPSQGAWV